MRRKTKSKSNKRPNLSRRWSFRTPHGVVKCCFSRTEEGQEEEEKEEPANNLEEANSEEEKVGEDPPTKPLV